MSKYTAEEKEWMLEKIKRTTDEEGDCLVWRNNENIPPRGSIPKFLSTSGKRKIIQLRQFVMEEVLKKPSPGKNKYRTITTCGNVKCLNPAHLKWASASEVAKETVKRTGYTSNPLRNLKISNSKRSIRKLTDEQAQYARLSPLSAKEVSAELGVSDNVIRNIRIQRTYKEYVSPWAGLFK